MNLKTLQNNFETLASQDPLWTVLSDNAKKGGGWDPAEFYQTGIDEIAWLEKTLLQQGLPLSGQTALDFGCGGGRLTFPLSKRFQKTIGIDIAPAMIAHTRQHASSYPNIHFHASSDPQLSQIPSSSIDFIYSNIVLQHIAPRHTRKYLRSFERILKPGGLLVFQLPSKLDYDQPANRRPFRMLQKRLHYFQKRFLNLLRPQASPAYFEMNAIRSDKLIRFLETKLPFQLASALEYKSAGPSWQSYLYTFRKRQHPKSRLIESG